MTRILVLAALTTIGWLAPAPLAAQSQFGIGPRVTFVRAGGSADGSQRFSGGLIRLSGGRTALELAMDYRSGVTGDLRERITDYPIQASLLVYPIRARVSPYLVGGIGWYTQRIEPVTEGQTVPIAHESTRRTGYHAGFGAELRLHRHLGVHGDYRYTFIGIGDDTSPAGSQREPFPGWLPLAERVKLSHEGSMFAWGATLYF